MYEAYFGLANLPFCIAPDSHFYVDAAPHRAAVRALQDRLSRGDEFMPLVGEFGAGKTTVGRRLLEEIDRKRQVAAELPRMRLDGDQLFDRVAEAFGMRRAGGVPPLQNVIRQLEGFARDGCEGLLLVDEAHQLDLSALRRLRKLTAVRVDGRAALRVCLAGPSLPPAFEALQRLGQPLDVGVPVRIERLDAAGTHTYILERLARAGWSGRPSFENTTAAIHERCKGNPARVNRLCGHILLHLYMQGRDDINPDVVRAVDELLQAELRGEPAALTLPPLLRATPDPAVLLEDFPAVTADRLYREALTAAHAAQAPSPSPPPPTTALVTTPPRSALVAYNPGPRRRGLAQGVAALALLVTGGFLWQMISNLATAHSESTLRAAVVAAAASAAAPPIPTAAGLAEVAQRTLERAPPAAAPVPVRDEVPATPASAAGGHAPGAN